VVRTDRPRTRNQTPAPVDRNARRYCTL